MANNTPIGQQLEFFDIPSPCVGVCEAGPRGYCKGCYRSREERLYWLKVDDATRRKIISACHRRHRTAMSKALKGSEPASQATDAGQINMFDVHLKQDDEN